MKRVIRCSNGSFLEEKTKKCKCVCVGSLNGNGGAGKKKYCRERKATTHHDDETQTDMCDVMKTQTHTVALFVCIPYHI